MKSVSAAAKPAPRRVSFRGTVQVKAAEGKGPRRFTLTAYTGEPMNLYGFPHPCVIDCSSIDVTAQRLPALLDHMPYPDTIVGQIDSVQVAAGGMPPVTATGFFTPTAEERDSSRFVLAKADAGYQWQVSVGGDPASVEEIKAGATGKANGREYPGPCCICRGMVLREISFVTLGGDRFTAAQLAARYRRSNVRASAMPTYEEWLTSMGFEDPSSLTPTQDANLRLKYQGEYPDAGEETATETPAAPTEDPPVTAAEGETDDDEEEVPVTARARTMPGANRVTRPASGRTPDPIQAMNNRMAANMKRIDSINAVAAEYGVTHVTVNGRAVALAAHAIAQNWSVDKTRLEAHLAARPQLSPSPLGGGSMPTGVTASRVIEAALCRSLGHKDREKAFKPVELEAADSPRFRNLTVARTVMIAAAANGYPASPGERLHSGNLRDVMESAFPRVRASGASTLSLPGILSNVANKEILIGYMQEDPSWMEIAQKKSVSDFKQVTSYRMLDDMEYEEVGADGRIKHGSTGEESYTRQAKTYAKMYSLTRRDLINDDMGAFADIQPRVGRGGAKRLVRVFWTAFVNNSSFFTAGRTNYITGSTTNLGSDGVGLGLGVKAFRQMTSPTADGLKHVNADTQNPVGSSPGGRPEVLLVPPELEAIGEALYRNQNLGQVATSSANIYANKYRPVVAWQLSDAAYVGYSTTGWYLFCAPGVMAPMVVSFLNGNETPVVETADADFDQLGIQFRGYHDFGCDQAEYLAGVKSKGAA